MGLLDGPEVVMGTRKIEKRKRKKQRAGRRWGDGKG